MPQQWEYCSIGPGERNWVFRYPLGSAGETVKRDKGIRGDKDWMAAFRLMDKLGAEGWELVSVAGEFGNRFYFKRARPAVPPTELLPVIPEPTLTQPTLPRP